MADIIPNGDGHYDHPGFLRHMERTLYEREKEFQIIRDDVNGLKNQQLVIQRDINHVATNLQALGTKLEENAKPNYTAIGLAATMFLAVLGGMSAYTSVSIAPVNSATAINGENVKHLTDAMRLVETQLAGNIALGASSTVDRAQTNERVHHLESALSTEVADRRAVMAAIKVSLAEVESQFHALSNTDNLRAAQQERLNSMLWEKSHPGDRYPNGTFFPTSIFGPPAMNSNGNGP